MYGYSCVREEAAVSLFPRPSFRVSGRSRWRIGRANWSPLWQADSSGSPGGLGKAG